MLITKPKLLEYPTKIILVTIAILILNDILLKPYKKLYQNSRAVVALMQHSYTKPCNLLCRGTCVKWMHELYNP